MSTPIPSIEIVPHRPPMLWSDQALFFDGRLGEAEFTICAGHPALNEAGELDEVALIEVLAQGFAACNGHGDRQDGIGARQGYLVAIRSFTVHGVARLGDKLSIQVDKEGDFGEFTIASGKIMRGDECLGEGSMRLWVAPVEDSGR